MAQKIMIVNDEQEVLNMLQQLVGVVYGLVIVLQLIIFVVLRSSIYGLSIFHKFFICGSHCHPSFFSIPYKL